MADFKPYTGTAPVRVKVSYIIEIVQHLVKTERAGAILATPAIAEQTVLVSPDVVNAVKAFLATSGVATESALAGRMASSPVGNEPCIPDI